MDTYISYWFLSAVKDTTSEVLYFMGNNIKGLFSWNLLTNEVSLLNSMEDRQFENEMYDCGVISNRKIYFPNRNTDKLAIYNIDTNRITYKDLYEGDVKEIVHYKPELFLGHFVLQGKDNKIFVVCREYPIITVIDTETDNIRHILLKEWDKSFLFLAKDYGEYKGSYYFPALDSNKVLIFNIQDETFECLQLDKCRDMKFSSCLRKDGKLILLSDDSKYIVQYDISTTKTNIIEIALEDLGITDNRRKIKEYNGNYYILPMLNINLNQELTTVYKLDRSFKIVSEKAAFEKYRLKNKWCVFSEYGSEWYFTFDNVHKHKSDAYWSSNVVLLKLNLDSMECEEMDFPIPKGWSKKMMSDKIIAMQTHLNFTYGHETVENDKIALQQLINELLLYM